MGDSIKFGPEWLRNMSNDSGGLSSAATSSTGGSGTNNFAYPNNQTRYPLAEYRYGREEMLSLYDKNFKLPELLPKFNKLFIEKMQTPLALLPPTADDDTPRGVTPLGSVSSERSGLGPNANSSSGTALGGISNAIGSIGMSARGIRGSSIDRGRGRARGGLYHSSLGNYQSRSGFVYDEDARGAGPRAERWAERNGNSTAEAEWSAANSSPSPRKDFSQLRSGPDGSWRRNRVDEDGQIPNGTNEGWRTTSSSITTNSTYKWPVRSTSWRGGDGDANSSFNSDGGPPRLERSKSTQGGVGSRELDGTGGPGMRRFVGMNANASWDEDNYPEWAMDEPIEGGGSFDATGAFLGNVDKTTGEKLKYQSTDGLHSDKQSQQSTKCDEKSESITSNGGNENDNSMTDTSENMNSIEDDAKPPADELIDASSQNETNKIGHNNNQLSSNIYETDKERKPNDEPISDSNYIDNAIIAINKQKSLTTDRMLEVAEDIEKLIMDDDQSCAESDDQLLPERVPVKHSTVDDPLPTVDKTKETDVSDLWYYRDPQGKIQGPFTATEMLEWYRAGYFDETLNVRRVCDPQFLELGELLKACSGPGAIPFISMPIISPLLQNNAKADISLSANAKNHPASPTKPLANLVHNHKILAPQPTPPTNTPGYYDMLQSQSSVFMNLMNAPPNDFLLSNSLPKHPNQNITNLPNALSKQAHLKNQQQTQSLQHLLSQHKKDFNAPDGVPTNNVPIIYQDNPVIRMLSSIKLPHQPNPANVLPVPTMPQPTPPQNNSFQSLMMQLHTIQKPHVLQQQIQQHHQQSIIMNAMNSSTLPRNHNTLGNARNPIDEITQQQQQQPQMPLQTDVRTAHGLWDLPIPPQMQPNANAKLPAMHNNIVPSSSMKTELQIIEHLHAKVKQQDVSRLQFPQFAGINNNHSMNHHHPQNETQQPPSQQQPHLSQQQQHHHQHQTQQPSQAVASSMVLGNIPNDLILQQSDMFRTKNDNIKDIQQLDANKQQSGVGKIAKNKTLPIQATIDTKSIQANNNNKINNNLIEPMTDEPMLLQSDKIDNNNKLNKAKNVNIAATATNKTPIEIKTQSKANNIAPNDDAIIKKSTNNNINANANANTIAPKTTTKESTKKKKEQKAADEKRRQQEEEERQQLEERKRLELIAAQRKAKLIDQNPARVEPTLKRNNLAASIAPWSNITENATANASSIPLTMSEIQKAERERRSELYRLEQAQQQNQALLDQQQHKESVLKWKLNPQNQAKSLAEIQAEESKARQQTTLLIAANQAQQSKQNPKKEDKWPVSTWSMIWGNDQSGNNNNTTNQNAAMQSGNGNSNCFWEDPCKSSSVVVQSKLVVQQNGTTSKPLTRSQTVSSMQSVSNESKAKQAAPLTTSGSAVAVNSVNSTKSNASATVTAASIINNNNNNSNNNNNNKKAKDTTTKPKKNATHSDETTNDEFGTWCNNKLAAHVNVIDVPTFVSFLRDIESPFEVKDYIRMYLGETKECSEFAKNFLERRSKYKNQQRAANAHIDDMCSPAPAITPANESQESKGKGKKEKKKNKMTKLDSRILGFSVTSAEDRLNVGARDYARDGP